MKNIFWKIKANGSLILACLHIYRKLLTLLTFLRVHSNSKVVSYLSWQNTYSNLKTTCHIKLKIFLWTKLLQNLLLAKYLISVPAPLNCLKMCIFRNFVLTLTRNLSLLKQFTFMHSKCLVLHFQKIVTVCYAMT